MSSYPHRISQAPSLRIAAVVHAKQIGGVVLSHLLSGVAATGDDGNTANLEELHFGVGRVVNGGMKGGGCWSSIAESLGSGCSPGEKIQRLWAGTAPRLRSRDILVSEKRVAPSWTPLPKAAAVRLQLWGSLSLESGSESFSFGRACLSNVPR